MLVLPLQTIYAVRKQSTSS